MTRGASWVQEAPRAPLWRSNHYAACLTPIQYSIKRKLWLKMLNKKNSQNPVMKRRARQKKKGFMRCLQRSSGGGLEGWHACKGSGGARGTWKWRGKWGPSRVVTCGPLPRFKDPWKAYFFQKSVFNRKKRGTLLFAFPQTSPQAVTKH